MRAMKQGGVALAVALILLVLITLIGLSAVRLSTLELRMSGNDELRVDAFEQAQSLVDSTIVNFANTPVLANGVIKCARSATGCTDITVTLPSNYTADLNNSLLNVMVSRINPASGSPPPGSGYSADNFASANLQVTGQYDKTSQGRGQATISEGISIVFPSSNQIYFTQSP